MDVPRHSINMGQKTALITVERTMSVVSIVGCLFIMGSFLFFQAPRKKSFNRLLFFASFGNLLSNVATFIGPDGLKSGESSATCKLQATLIQWFMPADCLWTFCMAVNVFLTFQTTNISVDIKKLEKWYFVICFGLPAIPALTFLLLDVISKTNYYGDATLWCWIRNGQDNLRLFTFYTPVWLLIIITLTLYAITGRAIYKGQVRNHLMRNALNSEPDLDLRPKPDTTRLVSAQSSKSDELAHTEALRISEPLSGFSRDHSGMIQGSINNNVQIEAAIASIREADKAESSTSQDHQSVNVTDAHPIQRSHNQSHALAIPVQVSATGSTELLNNLRPTTIASRSRSPTTPTPSLQITNPNTPPLYHHPRNQSFETRTNRGAKTYAQVAFLLFLVMLCIWVPSTANRVYGALHQRHNGQMRSFGLNMAAAVVLPLQGFFNTLIFMFTWRRELVAGIKKTWVRIRRPKGVEELRTERPEAGVRWDRQASGQEFVRTIDEDDGKVVRYPWHGEPKNASVIAVRVV